MPMIYLSIICVLLSCLEDYALNFMLLHGHLCNFFAHGG